ncbi:MAG: bifunctional phosphopantothenoylcysteine decarboxylase/phosphopantothenate--cysteine ligase CoaBC [Oscillospiraceae bacterium]|nr:bifunctional phosphopantothenoylcysteine decarboxylase/phosphopantothenate--cysteine ligase CoaBC [Oscillospiraceae bacterium]
MKKLLENKSILIGVTGGIASYKIPNLVRMLIKNGAEVNVIMTENAVNFINPFTFETLTKNKCIVDTFDRNFQYSVEHIALAKKSDIVLVAPATANIIGKISNGIADDMLSTTIMACTSPKLIAPAMNHNMFHNPIVQDNIKKLEHYGYKIIQPEHGMLANGDDGDGRLPDEKVLFEYIVQEIAFKKDLSGKRVLVTAGATQEAIDPVRYITNHSTGKMGYAIAENAVRRGAEVILISGQTNIEHPLNVKVVPVISAKDMCDAVMKNLPHCDIVIKSAAVADYTPETVSSHKIKKSDSDSDLSIKLKRTDDILKKIKTYRTAKQFICGFSMETENMLENSRKKLEEKNLDMICANSLNQKGAGFGTDTNIVTIITKDEEIQLEMMSKSEVASEILNKIVSTIDSRLF